MSSGRALLLRFRSDDNINSKGFSVAYDVKSFGNLHEDRHDVGEIDGEGSSTSITAPHPDEPV
jgi:hypothetical protein